MNASSWQPKAPFTAIAFDCDSTLSHIEGIDELARDKNVLQKVAAMTNLAKNKVGMTPELYQARLDIVKPSKEQIEKLGELYCQTLVPDATEIIQILQRLDKTIYLVSAGFYPAICKLGKKLKVLDDNIYAVGLSFNDKGEYLDFDLKSPLIHTDGKKIILEKIKKDHAQVMLIGDGITDLITQSVVTRFVGFGGVVYREAIAENAEYYVRSFTELLPLILTQNEVNRLDEREAKLYEEGLESLRMSFS